MILETKSNGRDILIEDNAIIYIEECGSQTKLYLYGSQPPIKVDMDFEGMKKILIEAKSRDRFTDQPERKSNVKLHPIVVVGEYKFSLQTWEVEYADGVAQYLKIFANFPVKNDIIKTSVEYIPGIEKYCDFSFSKYEGNISIGKLFDIEKIREQVEQKIRECIE